MCKPKARRDFPTHVAVGRYRDRELYAQNAAQLGISYEQLSAIKPDLIMLSTCMQGQTGPNRDYPGFGNLMAALSGFYYAAGYSPSEPCPPYGAYTDFIAPRFSACALIAALDYRRRTGKGQYIDMAQYEASLHNMAPAMVDYFATGRVLGPSANRSERYAPHNAYRCADLDGHERWIAIAVANDDEWAVDAESARASDAEPAFATMTRSMQQREPLDRLIGELVRERNADDLTNALQAAGVAAYPVQNCLDIHRDENLEAFGFWHWLDHQAMGPSPYQGLEHRMSRTPGALRSPAPVIGQHNDEVFNEILGMSANEIEELKREKVIY